MDSSAKLLEDSLLIIWNDRDPEKRLKAMAEIYAADIVFYESNDGPAIEGYEAINELISKLQSQWPLEFKFELSRPSHVNHQVQHITWTLGIPGQTPVATGMDIAIVENHQIKLLHLLLDAPAQ
ncbi:nuclear transport factor 2 family protein [Mucilaginibacter terrenus]|uniref:Nuclear transport factor 2 family protein n=2 Tax=Mucilaginibacter terrenus TaxID=2482727 RepID=A0A3E2NYD0_9SPHI|nr:nuclear transport factor 2 family protein [Mucilaginibacter terrenus]